MTLRTLALASLMTIAAAGSLRAQTPSPAAAPQPRGRSGAPATETPRPRVAPPASETPQATAPAAPERPRREGQPINVKVDLTLTDQRGGSAPVKRTVTVLAADGYTGSIRTQSQVIAVGAVPLNVDASPTLLADGKIRLGINLQYRLARPHRDQLGAGDGRQHVASRSADDDSRKRQVDDRGAIGGPDRRAAGDGGGEGDGTAIEKLASW